MSAYDFVLHDGALVTATGKVNDAPDGSIILWVMPCWGNPRVDKLNGGDVELIEQKLKLPRETPVKVVGRWRNGTIIVDSAQKKDVSIPVAPTVLPTAPHPGGENDLEYGEPVARLREVLAAAEGFRLASGGSPRALSIQVLHISTRLASWLDKNPDQEFEIYSSIEPFTENDQS